jgi:hypothetical protein
VASAALAPPTGGHRFGIAHIDLMDLHLVRTPEGPRAVQALPAAEIARRYRQARETGARWHRWSLYWDLVDRAGLEWAEADGIVARDAAHGLRSLIVLQPTAPGPVTGGDVPPGLDLPIFVASDGTRSDEPSAGARPNPDNRWATFVGAAATRLAPAGVHHWEIGNEPNFRHFWGGSPAEYARLLEVAYLVLHQVDAGAVVAHGGIGDDAGSLAWFGRFLDALVAKNAATGRPARHGWYFDRTAWHWYSVPSRLAAPPAAVRATLAARGIPAKPIWVTELGAPVWSEHPGPCWDPRSPGRVSLAEQAAFAWQAAAEGLAAGVELLIWFQMADDCGNGPDSYDAFGLVRNALVNACWTPAGRGDQGCWRPEPANAGQPRPVWFAWQTAVGVLGDARPLGAVSGPGWRGQAFRDGLGRRITALWALGGAAARVPAAGPAARAEVHSITAGGLLRRTSQSAAGGGYGVTLPGSSNRNGPGGRPMVDGLPVLVVEQGGGPGLAAGASSGLVTSIPLPDTAPPVLAVVGVLPPESPPTITLEVAAGDEGDGLAFYVLYWASGPPPARPEAWIPLGGLREWPGPGHPRLARVTVPFEGQPGRSYWFAAQAGDAAGNWTPPPTYPQAWTRVVGARGRPGGSVGAGYR